MQAGNQTRFQHNRCHERARKGRETNEVREMVFAEFSTLSDPALRSAPVPSFPQPVCLRFRLRARGAYALSLVMEAGVPHPRSYLEVCVCTGDRCGEFQMGTPPEKKKRQQGCRTPNAQNFVRQIFEDRQLSSSSICGLCLDRVFT